MADADRPDDAYHLCRFGGGMAEGGAADADRLGGKGANLAEMARIGLPVPPGFTLPVALVAKLAGSADRDGLAGALRDGLDHLERATGKCFGDPADPLLVSVRSGARVSMPGMMDTVLDLGLNDATVAGLAAAGGDERFAWDSYRRFIQMHAEIVLGLSADRFEEALEVAKEDRGVALDTGMTAEDWRALVAGYGEIVRAGTGAAFPQDVHEQLHGAVRAVAGSWRSERAAVYRRLHNLPEEGGTAVTVQAMVFGNAGERSATGVAFTRDPSTGERAPFGEFLVNAQGEDIVAGLRTPGYLTRAARELAGARALSMEEAMPAAYRELTSALSHLERHFRDMQDAEFTVEQGRLWLLQTRPAKRTATAAIRMAVEMAGEGLITRDEAILRVDPATLDHLLRPMLDLAAPHDVIATGLPASPGAASGEAVFDAATARARAAAGASVILIRAETSPDDIGAMHAARGVVTVRGGMTSHAAVVARGMGRPCVTAVADLRIDAAGGVARCGEREIRTGDIVTLDGATGQLMWGEVPTIRPVPDGDLGRLLDWADEVAGLPSHAANASPADRLIVAQAAIALRRA